VVTGANSGIGRAIASALLERGCRVVLVCRDEGRGREAIRTLRELDAGADVELVLGDLSSLAGSRAAAEAIQRACPRLDVLIHNAGVWPVRLVHNEDGFEESFATNALAPLVLSKLLEDRLVASRARVVQVSAGLHVAGRIDLQRTPIGADFSRFRTYADTKLWNLLCTRELARRAGARGVTVNAVHPGVVRTGLGDMPGPMGLLLRAFKLTWSTPAKGARGPVRLALDDDLDGVTDTYFDQLRPAKPGPLAEDRELARAVWDRTLALAGLDEPHAYAAT
jgi:NAD(P)-dependent dehydrogenase (short-subunit alcohol dehydrogenase family)